jgi:hypothetical protein
MNINTSLGLVNGAEVELVSICYDSSKDVKKINDHEFVLKTSPAFILIRLCRPNNRNCPKFLDLNDNLIPLFPKKKKFDVPYSSMKNITVQRVQFPLTLAFGLTAFKAQGKSLKKVIIDLTEPITGKLPQHYAYSALSRATCLDSIIILRPFRIKVIQESPHTDLLEE